MRRTDRLFQIIQLLRCHRSLTAAEISDHLEVSIRTIYRDIQDISLSVPVIALPGIGYSLDKAYNLPPVTFTDSELEALFLGARMVQAWTDKELAIEATRALQRIESVLPENLKPALNRQDLQVPDFFQPSEISDYMPTIRENIRCQRKLKLHYQRKDQARSHRVIWPLGLFYWGQVWTLVAWCELRHGFRQFRVDRMLELEPLSDEFQTGEDQSLAFYLQQDCGYE